MRSRECRRGEHHIKNTARVKKIVEGLAALVPTPPWGMKGVASKGGARDMIQRSEGGIIGVLKVLGWQG